MIVALMGLWLAAGQPQAEPVRPTLPRQADTQPYERDESKGVPTDPLFDRELVATDDASFILNAVENTRQSTLDAQGAAAQLHSAQLRETAAAISAHNQATLRALEALAKRKGWRLPESNPERATTLPASGPTRAGANFIRNQIGAHQAVLAQYRAQIAGKGDPELKRALRQALPGYERNLARLLAVKP